MDALQLALQEWHALLGAARVHCEPAYMDAYAASTSAHPVWPLAALYPDTHEEVAGAVRIAAAYRIPLHPLSTGCNWGYGDACPTTPGQVVLDLSHMRRILSVDSELAYAVLEPGVTQADLSRHLRERELPLWMDCTGAGPDTSIVGNILERGFGHSPYGNRFQHTAGMRIVLADGSTLDTGFGHFPHASATYLWPYGVGPWLDGLFTQSGLGIVTRLGFWLMPQAEMVSHLVASVATHQEIAAVVDALRPLRLDNTLSSVLHIGNDLRVLSGGIVFPAAQVPQGPPLPDDVRRTLCASAGIAPWTVSAALYGSRAQVTLAQRAVRRALSSCRVRLRFIDDRRLAWADTAARLLGNSAAGRRLAAQAALGRALLNMNRGVPDGRFLAGAYWRRRGGLPPGFPAGANPARDGCGMMWLSPVMPLRGAALLQVHGLVAPLFRQYGFDLFETYSMLNGRTLGGVLTICFDQDDAGETARASDCHGAALDALLRAGFIPYRVGPQAMPALGDRSDNYWQTVARIKAALDPDQLIDPGRYAPG